jgi:hypothetical protein
MINVTTVVRIQNEDGSNTDDSFGTVTRTYDGHKTLWQPARKN